MSFWYFRHPDEIFVDLDGKTEAKHGARLRMSRRRLRAAIEQGKLFVKDVWFYPSQTPLHHHLIVRTMLGVVCPQAWALYLGSDVYRASNNLMREALFMAGNMPDPRTYFLGSDLLIVPEPYFRFYRRHDAECSCVGKHSLEMMGLCPVAANIRGKYRTADFFGKPNREFSVWEHFGKVKP
jgi:hypothetical protein